MFSTANTEKQNVLLVLWVNTLSGRFLYDLVGLLKFLFALIEIHLHVFKSCFTAFGGFILSSFFLPPEDKQKKKKQQKEKSSVEGKTSLQRSKTFVNLFFKKDRKEKSRSKSPSHNADRGDRPFLFLLSGPYSAIHQAEYTF